jgi:alcohol dehydrogenase class IV
LQFRDLLKIPPTLAMLGIDASRAAEIGTMAAADPSAGGNPCTVEHGDLERIFRAAIEGKL